MNALVEQNGRVWLLEHGAAEGVPLEETIVHLARLAPAAAWEDEGWAKERHVP